MSVSILLVAIATLTIPIAYHSIQNPFLGFGFTKDNSSYQLSHQSPSNEPVTNQYNASTNNQASMIENRFIIDTYIGTIGEKDFKLLIEKVDGDNVEGHNLTGTNKRPVKGKIVNKRTAPTGLGGHFTIFKIVLAEPGDDKWDGEFNIELWISDIDRHGEGNWKSFSGQLERKIKIKDQLNE